MQTFLQVFEKIISPENLFCAWEEFRAGKTKRKDVCQFEFKLEENMFKLHDELKTGNYRHGSYGSFYIQDPKQRHIHKADVRDRVLHHAIFCVVNPIFEPTFISDSFSCRIGKGTHKGIIRLKKMFNKASKNNKKTCFALKMDIRKFFDSVDHSILIRIMEKRIKDSEAMALLREIVGSYPRRSTHTHTHR